MRSLHTSHGSVAQLARRQTVRAGHGTCRRLSWSLRTLARRNNRLGLGRCYLVGGAVDRAGGFCGAPLIASLLKRDIRTHSVVDAIEYCCVAEGQLPRCSTDAHRPIGARRLAPKPPDNKRGPFALRIYEAAVHGQRRKAIKRPSPSPFRSGRWPFRSIPECRKAYAPITSRETRGPWARSRLGTGTPRRVPNQDR